MRMDITYSMRLRILSNSMDALIFDNVKVAIALRITIYIYVCNVGNN